MLDIHNPRFSSEPDAPHFSATLPIDDPRAQETTRKYLLSNFDITPLIESILRIGFLTIDRIVVKKITPEAYVAVEGNRRLAAIKTILGKIAFRIISPPEHIITSLMVIEALLLPSYSQNQEHQALLIQGLRHISGTRRWGPYQQGKLIHTLTQHEGMTLRDASTAVGMHSSRASALLHGYCGLHQMQKDADYHDQAHANLFSHFEQAYAKIRVREWLEWDKDKLRYSNTSNLKKFYGCISQNTGSHPRLLARHVRDLLPAVLQHPTAYHRFFSNKATIQEAFTLSQEGKSSYHQLTTQMTNLKRLLGKLALDAPPPDKLEIETIRQIHKLTKQLLQQDPTNG